MSRAKDGVVGRPTKRAEFQIIFISRQAEKGWIDALATSRNAIVDAWDRLTTDPLREDPKRVYRLKGELAQGRYEGQEFDRYQYKITDSGRIWYFVQSTKGAKTAGVVLLERCDTGHPRETE